MTLNSIFLFLNFSFFLPNENSVQQICDEYITAWKNFYPSKAVDKGFHGSIFLFEDFSQASISKWIDLNLQITKEFEVSSMRRGGADRINARLLMTQAQKELDRYRFEKVHQQSLTFYTNIISSAISSVQKADYLTKPEQQEVLCSRLKGISSLCQSAKQNLTIAEVSDLERGIRQLQSTFDLIGKTPLVSSDLCIDWKEQLVLTQKSIKELISYANEELVPKAQPQTTLGKEAYNRALAVYVDHSLTADELAELALKEITTSKKLILERSKQYLLDQYPKSALPKSDSAIIALTFADMEKDAPANSREYLSFWQDLRQAAVDFLKEKNLVTLPKHETLRILTAPESAGPAARIGWVDVSPPFAPSPMTTLYLPSIPDTLDQQEQIDFWSSFNKPFNRMIAIHELYPGHYMQFQIARETPYPVRILFPYEPYIEGWATFIEVVALDHGWESERSLSYLAHLRKRLENANRAYMSVMVHTQGWNQGQVMSFSTETSLLAPQFAKSLWGRLLRSPMQITSYCYGGLLFRELLKTEQERLGSDFKMKEFLDTILVSGPIPIDEYYPIFELSAEK